MHLTFKQYKIIDICVIALLLCFFEALIIVAGNKWFLDRQFSLSVVIVIIALAMMRWNGFAVIHALAGGLVYAITQTLTAEGNDLFSFCLVFGIGNCFGLFALIMFKMIGKAKIRDSIWLTSGFVILVYLLVEIGRSVVSVILGDLFTVIMNYLFYDCISLFFALILIYLLRKLDGMFEDQKVYLFRLERERIKEKE